MVEVQCMEVSGRDTQCANYLTWTTKESLHINYMDLKGILRLKNIYVLYNAAPFTDHNAHIGILQIALCIVYRAKMHKK